MTFSEVKFCKNYSTSNNKKNIEGFKSLLTAIKMTNVRYKLEKHHTEGLDKAETFKEHQLLKDEFE